MASGPTSVSSARLVHPLLESALAMFLKILRDVPARLAAPFVEQELRRCGFVATALDVGNILFKLPAAGLCGADVDLQPGPALKQLQARCTDSPTIYIEEKRTHCVCNRPLSEGELYESFDQQIPLGMHYEPSVGPTRFRAFTLHAGLQFAVFRLKYCAQC